MKACPVALHGISHTIRDPLNPGYQVGTEHAFLRQGDGFQNLPILVFKFPEESKSQIKYFTYL
jgi:hypothetical protein